MSVLHPPPYRPPFSLEDFVSESLYIEEKVRRKPTEKEMEAHKMILDLDDFKFKGPEFHRFVDMMAPGAQVRTKYGMEVMTSDGHLYPKPNEGIQTMLTKILMKVDGPRPDPAKAYWVHKTFEQLHPFTDGNGRAGRVIWLWIMGGIVGAPLGFLHTYYYQALRYEKALG